MTAQAGIIAVVLIIVYFIPVVVASSRNHRSTGAIFLVNLLLGWSIIGWLWALIWASTGNVERVDPNAPTPQTHVKCPDCAELVRAEARVCKHCGCKLVPQSLATAIEDAPYQGPKPPGYAAGEVAARGAKQA